MNDPEVTMLDALPNSNLFVYRKALDADLAPAASDTMTGRCTGLGNVDVWAA